MSVEPGKQVTDRPWDEKEQSHPGKKKTPSLDAGQPDGLVTT